jgi:hypothetical protein
VRKSEAIRAKFNVLRNGLDERARRVWAATEAIALGHGGMLAVSEATGISLPTIRRGVRDVLDGSAFEQSGHIRLRGAGRKRASEIDPTLAGDLEKLIDPTTRGDPMSPLRWTCKSTRQLARELQRTGHDVSAPTVGTLLHSIGYSLQGTRKTREGSAHPDRDAQFGHISARVKDFQERNQPVISVDTKKKEIVGDFKNAGREWQPKGQPEQVRVHDFIDATLGKAIPYGVYDVAHNKGWVSVGIDHDTPAFAVQSIRSWWLEMGCSLYPNATELLITADGGGSNSSRARLWKLEMQRLADQLHLRITVCHFPPGTSKWNKIEHRMFCHITRNWRGKPLVSTEVIVNLIAGTTTTKGLRIKAKLDTARYPTGVGVTDAEIAALNIDRAAFHGDWNYTFVPRSKSSTFAMKG